MQFEGRCFSASSAVAMETLFSHDNIKIYWEIMKNALYT
jgi:hypothetical protein